MNPTQEKPVADSLVLYKIRPARVLNVGDKIEIQLQGGQTKRVRPKDIHLLHPGPLKELAELAPLEGELVAAWELMEGENTHLSELAELIFEEYSPASAWAAWQWVADGLYFQGTPEEIRVRSRTDVERDRAARAAKDAAERDWADFMARLQRGRLGTGDRERLAEVERLALRRSEHSRILRVLGHAESAANAHRLLVRVGYWEPNHNPYPARFGVTLAPPSLPLSGLPDEQRRDLTHLDTFAIDDEGNQDPDDAISLDGDRLWVHVADVAALVGPDSDLDREARARGASLYIPETLVPMLPPALTERLGLGLAEISPALSFGFRVAADGAPEDLEILPSTIRVRRLSYAQAERHLDAEPLRTLLAETRRFRERRHARNAAVIELPEVKIRVVDGAVHIDPIPRLRSRELVTDAMLMAGEAVARYCEQRDIAIPYATQDAPEGLETPRDLAAMFAYRRGFKPTRLTVDPAPHFGLGLEIYTRATSPLRRYSDLLVHQQLRAQLAARAPLSADRIGARVAEAETAGLAIRRAERLSNTHWKLVYLRDHPDWSGEAIVVAGDGQRVTATIPELALDTRVRVRGQPGLNARLALAPREIDLPELTCYFRVRE